MGRRASDAERDGLPRCLPRRRRGRTEAERCRLSTADPQSLNQSRPIKVMAAVDPDRRQRILRAPPVPRSRSRRKDFRVAHPPLPYWPQPKRKAAAETNMINNRTATADAPSCDGPTGDVVRSCSRQVTPMPLATEELGLGARRGRLRTFMAATEGEKGVDHRWSM